MSATAHAQALLDYIDASPSPWHAAHTSELALREKGFSELIEGDTWSLERKGRYYVKRDDSSIIAFTVGANDLAQDGFRLLGAHTDSPGLRVKPKPDNQLSGVNRLGVEVYGGALLATFTDRDLSLAGRVHINNNRAFVYPYFMVRFVCAGEIRLIGVGHVGANHKAIG